MGGTVAYAYFPNKEALFLAAVDEDAAGVIQEGPATVLDVADVRGWHDTLIFTFSTPSGATPWLVACWPVWSPTSPCACWRSPP